MGSSNPIPKNLIKMSEEVKTDAAPAEAPTAEDLEGQKRSLEEEAADGEIKKAKTANGSSNGADMAENGEAEGEDEEEGDEEEDLDEEDELDGEEGEEDLDEEAEGEEGEEEEDGEGEEEEDEEDA